MANDKKTGFFTQLFSKDDKKKKKSCCCCKGFEIEEIEGPENNDKENKKEDSETI